MTSLRYTPRSYPKLGKKKKKNCPKLETNMTSNGDQVPTQANKHFLLQGHLRVIKDISQR